jgi:cbb3-type cytochrome oxidase cytochrome c subunit
MKHGPLIFLGVLSAVMASWVTAVVVPHFQIGSLELVNLDDLGIDYPLDRSGEAKQGAVVFRAQGCNYCHTQQIRQETLLSNLTLEGAGTNATAVAAALQKVRHDLDASAAAALVKAAPQRILSDVAPLAADQVMKLLTNAGAKVEMTIANLGSDLRRGWGTRRTVTRDYLRDQPVMLGQVRYGPDLANIGARETNTIRLLQKLYNPRILLPGSTMPRYPYLFEERRVRPGGQPAADALPLPEGFAPGPGIEIVPKPEALQLAAYLESLKSEPQFYEAFMPAQKKPDTGGTNTAPVSASVGAAAAPATNAPATP